MVGGRRLRVTVGSTSLPEWLLPVGAGGPVATYCREMSGPDTPQNPPGWSTPQPGWQQPPGQGYPPQQPPGQGYPPQQPPGFPPQQPPSPGYPPQQPPGFPPQQPSGQGYPPQQPPGYPQPGMYGAPQPGSPFPPAAPAKKRSTLKTVLLVLLVLFVLGLAGCGALVYFGAKTIGAPVDTANQWLDALEDERSSAQLEALSCDGLFDKLDDVRDQLAARGWTGGQNLTSSNIVNNQATVTGTLEYATTDVGVSIELDKVGGEWCVYSIETDA